MSLIKLNDVWKVYPNSVKAINGMSIEFNKGEFVYIVGPSGAGKSTFIRLLYREEKASKGEIYIDNVNLSQLKQKEVPHLRRRVGVVFQDFKLLQSLTVYENIAFALEVIEEDPAKIKQKVMDVLDLVKIKSKAKFYPSELSGGEQQRVAIARAVVNRPDILIADEPTGNLDPDTAWSIMDILENVNALGTTVIMATHNKEIVNTLKRRVIAIEAGRVVRDEARGNYGYEV
ncbi:MULTISPECIES: cell division ATP-binding protein FtsE [Shouchella]|uniref:Cell division ATP-binding protein FtsE n=3 Tax=Bacillaceae TaxID=186817 RepID=A0A060M6A8_9BACI|nr:MULTISPECIES: cell division ATP-binding protein FtsE [Bacillaceae]AIC95599.1 Cell division ATP-binding protein FtsE [Shouchella lehensis G1]RQW21320.1 cell division ATP-binding protein FtsE [Bacillus sp. C1-1]TES51352.1 cell division ATP-binding protein FtsE [Shouchella lehensis]